MAKSLNLGRVTDLIKSIERISGDGSAGSLDVYRITTESGVTHDFTVQNGRNGTTEGLTIDSELKENSTNPIENQAVAKTIKKNASSVDKLTSLFELTLSDNIFTKEGKTDGIYLDPSTNAENSNAGYSASDFLEVYPDTDYIPDSFGYSSYQIFCNFYDSGKTFISGGVYTTGNMIAHTPVNCVYVRLSFPTSQADVVRMTKGSTRFQAYHYLPLYYPPFTQLADKAVRSHEIYVEAGGNLHDVFAKITDASEGNPYIVYLQKGTYNALDGFTSEETGADGFSGLFIPDGVTLVGMGKREETIVQCVLETASDMISTINFRHTAGAKNITFKGVGTRYVCHDDFVDSSYRRPYKRVIENCAFIGSNLQKGSAYGSGFKQGAEWRFDNCYFETTSANGAFTVHSWNSDDFTIPADIELKNCVFNSEMYGIRIGAMKSGTVNRIRLIHCNLSAIKVNEELNDGCGIDFDITIDGCSADYISLMDYSDDGEYFINDSRSVVYLQAALSAISKGDCVYRNWTACVKTSDIGAFYGVALKSVAKCEWCPIQFDGCIDVNKIGLSCAIGDKIVIANGRLAVNNTSSVYVAKCVVPNVSVELTR